MTMNVFDMTGQVVLVTGSTRGMGLAMVQLFVEYGARVIVSGRNGDLCKTVAEDLNRSSGRDAAHPIQFDLADEESGYRLIEESIAKWGRMDGLVANAFTSFVGPMSKTTSADFMRVLQTNVVNAALMVERAVETLAKSSNASITFVGSIGGLNPSPGVMAYSTSKRALVQVMLNYASELAPKGIRSNLLAPGATNTDVMKDITKNENTLKAYTALFPLPKMIEPEEVAAAALLLVSPAGRSMTGQTLALDNGRMMPLTPSLPEGYDFN